MDSLSTLVLAISLIIIMLGMGLSLTIDDFRRVIREPKAALTGLINQLVFLPIIGFVLVSVFDVRPEIAIGMMLLAACPGGPTSNLITHLSKGDTALSVSLTAVSSVITIVTIPLIMQFSLDYFMGKSQSIDLDIPKIIGQLFVITILPVCLGMLLKSKAPGFSQRMDKPVKIASAFVFVLVLAGVILKERANLSSYLEQAGLFTFILNILTMTLGFAASKLMKLSKAQAISISIESGIQNGTLAITIATVTLMNTEFAIAPAIYSLIMFVTSIGWIVVGNRK
jgi:bile acid:Na+ symporter, BASS family